MGERDRFNDEEEIKWLYEKIGDRFEKRLIITLKKQKILPEDGKYDVAPDFEDIDHWRISTIIHTDYTADGPSKKKEDIKSIKGFLCLTVGTLRLYPPFPFEFEASDSKFSFNPEEVRKVIEENKEQEEWSMHSLYGETGKDFTVFDKERDMRLEKLRKETIPMLKGVGFSEDESQLMVLGAMKHAKFTEDMAPEGLVGLALSVRGSLLTHDV